MDNYYQDQNWNQPQNQFQNQPQNQNQFQNQSPNGDTGVPYQQDPFRQASGYQRPVVVDQLAGRKDRLATTSLILGILGIFFCWSVIPPFILCLIGLIMGIMSFAKTNQYSGVALAGVLTSAAGMALSCLFFFVTNLVLFR